MVPSSALPMTSLITARTGQDAKDIQSIVEDFLRQRGLMLSEKKTKVVSVYDGFTFMSHHYQKRDGWVYTAPSRSAIDRCKQGLHELITSHKRSQRELIESANRRLTGWATHHRYTDARAAFAEIDGYVDKLLHQSAYSKHSKMSEKKVDNRYWFQTPGRRKLLCPAKQPPHPCEAPGRRTYSRSL
ncbi:hypothetical protein D5272_15050 [bacterium D16-76]|nr:hypothetical protein [bacterium D16-76]